MLHRLRATPWRNNPPGAPGIRPFQRRVLAVTLAAFLAAQTVPARADTPDTYTGPENGLWSDPSNWSVGVPDSPDFDALLTSPGGLTTLLNSTETVGVVTVSTGNALSFEDGGSLTTGVANVTGGTLTLEGTSSYFDYSTLNVSDGGVFIWNSGVLETPDFTPSAAIATNLQLPSGMNLIVDDTLSLPNGTSVTVSGGTLSAGNLIVDGGSYTLTKGLLGAPTITLSSGAFLQTGGTLSYGTFTQTGGVSSLLRLALGTAGAIYNLQGGTLTLPSLNGSALNWTSGALAIAGSINIPNAALGTSPTIAAGQLLQVGTRLSVEPQYELTISGGTLSAASEDIIGAGTLLQTAGTLVQTGGINLAGSLTLQFGDGGIYLLSGGTLTATAEYLGQEGGGAFTQSGGTNSASFEYLGQPGLGSAQAGNYNQSGGINSVGSLLIAPPGRTGRLRL